MVKDAEVRDSKRCLFCRLNTIRKFV
jgi:hypothetical protein